MSEFSNYPRGQPYKPPPDKPATDKPEPAKPGADPVRSADAQLRAWVLRIAIGTVVAVALIVGIGGYLVVRAVRSPATVAEREPIVRSTEARAASSTDTRPAAVGPNEPGQAVAQRDQAVIVVDNLLDAHLHQTFLNIGYLADGVEAGLYSDEDAKEYLTEITELMDAVDGQLNHLSDIGVRGDGLKRQGRARQVTLLLRAQAKELRAYWDIPEKDKEKKKEQRMKYDKAHEEADKGLSELLDAKD